MRRLSIAVALGALTTLTLAIPATAGTIDGDCTASAVSGDSFTDENQPLDSKTVATATEADPFKIDPAGSVEWDASSDVPLVDHSWGVGLVIGGIQTQFFSGGDPNSAMTQDSEGRVSIADRLDEIQLSQMSWVIDQLNGKFQAWGNIEAKDGTFCKGTAWVEIDGSFGAIGLLGALGAAAGAGLLVRAGVAKS